MYFGETGEGGSIEERHELESDISSGSRECERRWIERRDNGAAYNYQEDKADAQLSLFTDFPCGPDVLVNTKILERTLKFIKQLIANEVGPLNDIAKDGIIPGDLRSAPQHASVTKIYSEKTWHQITAYSKL